MKPRKKRERPSLAKLVEFCDGDEDAAMWMARTWSDWGARDPAHARTFYRVTIQGYFEARREEFEAGSKEALFAAIAHAARMDTPIPEWAREPFATAGTDTATWCRTAWTRRSRHWAGPSASPGRQD